MKNLRGEQKQRARIGGNFRYCAVAAAMLGAAVVGGVASSSASKSASKTAANAQTQAADMGIQEQRRQFDAMQTLMAPYTAAGLPALGQQQDILGLNGREKQGMAISGIENSAQFGSMMQQGENAILQNASATGGLRGGNTQGALAQFRPQLLNQLIDQQYSRLGGMTTLGQNSAAGVGAAGMASGNQITQLLGNQGAAQAGAALAGGRADAQMYNGISNAFGQYLGGQGSRPPSPNVGVVGPVDNTLF
ncbi:MAG: hypothetical protein V4857_14255 [Pseudomonadota bacterium]